MLALRIRWISAPALLICLLVLSIAGLAQSAPPAVTRTIQVPGEDRFVPFAITIHVGDTVRWVNNDTDAHYVVSDDAFNTSGRRGVNTLIQPGKAFALKFSKAGVFPFYCRFHAALDAHNQPIAPGPFGGIQDSNGNFGTPMSGVVTVVP